MLFSPDVSQEEARAKRREELLLEVAERKAEKKVSTKKTSFET
jgi:hypothetical protein